MKWIVYLIQHKTDDLAVARFRYREDAEEFCSNQEYNLLDVYIKEDEESNI